MAVCCFFTEAAVDLVEAELNRISADRRRAPSQLSPGEHDADFLGLESDARGEPGPRFGDEAVEQRVVVEAQAPIAFGQLV